MAMTELTLVFVGTLATLATVALFLDFADRWTELVVTLAAVILWGAVGLSASDVVVGESSVTVEPLVYLGYLFAGVLAIYALADLIRGIGDEASEAADGDLFG